MANESLTGVIQQINDIKQISDSFKVREFVLKIVDGKYPQYITLQAANKNLEPLSNLEVGDEITTNYNLKGRIYSTSEGLTKYFNTIEAWGIQLVNYNPKISSNQMPKNTIIDEQQSDLLPF